MLHKRGFLGAYLLMTITFFLLTWSTGGGLLWKTTNKCLRHRSGSKKGVLGMGQDKKRGGGVFTAIHTCTGSICECPPPPPRGQHNDISREPVMYPASCLDLTALVGMSHNTPSRKTKLRNARDIEPWVICGERHVPVYRTQILRQYIILPCLETLLWKRMYWHIYIFMLCPVYARWKRIWKKITKILTAFLRAMLNLTMRSTHGKQTSVGRRVVIIVI